MKTAQDPAPDRVRADETVIALLAQGAPEAIEILYDRYGRLAYSVAYGVVKDAGSAEDVVQDAFLSIWRRGSTYDPERGGLGTWVCRITRNRAIDRLRGRSGQALRELTLDQTLEPAALSDASEAAMLELDRKVLRRAVDALPAAQRESIELAYFNGYSQSEISDLIRIPLGTVKARTRAALGKLRVSLREPATGWTSS